MATYTEECSRRNHTFAFVCREWKSSSLSLNRICTTCQPCVVCHERGVLRVDDKPYCEVHSKDAKEKCKKDDPTTREDLYGLLTTPSETKWIYIGKRLKNDKEARRRRYFSNMKSKDDFLKIEQEARRKAKEDACRDLMRKREVLVEAAREYKKAKDYLDSHIDFVEDEHSYTV